MSDKIERIIDALRKKILEEAIRGNLVPQNPEDEPASVLLQRIEAERERLIKEKKIKRPKSVSKIFRRDGHFYESINGGEPTCIDDDIPFDIPNSWEWCRLASLCQNINAGGDKPQQVSKIATEVLSVPIYANGEKDKGLFGYTDEARVTEPSITVSARGNIGFSCIRNTPFVPIVRLIVVTPFVEFSIEYLQLVLESLREESTGTSIPQLTVPMLSPKLIPVPPSNEQIRIIEALSKWEQLFHSLHSSRNRYKRILSETPTSLRQQLIQAAIQGQLVPQNPNDEPASLLLERIAEERIAKLGKKAAKSMSRIVRRGSKTYEFFPDGSEKDISDDIPFDIPDSWEWCRLSYISYGLQYGTSQKSNSTGKYAVLRMGNIQNGEIDFSDLVYSNNDVDFSKLELKKGDVLFNRTNSPEWVGKTAIFRNHKTPCIFAGYLIRINQSELIVGAYLNYFLNSSSARKQGDAVVSLAVNQANISGKKLSDYFIPIPPLSEQHRIVDKLDALLKLV